MRGHEDPEGEYRYSSTLFLTLELDVVGGQSNVAATSTWGRRQAGWTPGPGWTGVEKLAPTGIPSTDPSSSISKAETKIKVLKFNVNVFKSQSNSFWLRAASECSDQPTFPTRASFSIIRVLTWTIKVLFLVYKNMLRSCYKNNRLRLPGKIIGDFYRERFHERHSCAKPYNLISLFHLAF